MEIWDKEFQPAADILLIVWVLVHGRNSVYNYIHCMGAGHFRDYGKALKSLAVYAQEVQIQLVVHKLQKKMKGNKRLNYRQSKHFKDVIHPMSFTVLNEEEESEKQKKGQIP